MRSLTLALLALLAIAVPAVAAEESSVPTDTVAGFVPPKPPLKLSDEQKARVAQAIKGQDTLDKLPEGFSPAIGARMPVEDKLPEYPLPRPLVYEVPVLKQYYYVQLDDQVLIVDPMTKTVAEIVKR
jgi:hypothetical protein